MTALEQHDLLVRPACFLLGAVAMLLVDRTWLRRGEQEPPPPLALVLGEAELRVRKRSTPPVRSQRVAPSGRSLPAWARELGALLLLGLLGAGTAALLLYAFVSDPRGTGTPWG